MSGNTNGAGNGQADTSKPVALWLAGNEVVTDTTFDVISPQTSEKLWTSSSVSVKQANQAVDAAQEALKSWRQAKPAQIRTIFLKAADVLESREDELMGYMKEETGALNAFATFNVKTCAEYVVPGDKPRYSRNEC